MADHEGSGKSEHQRYLDDLVHEVLTYQLDMETQHIDPLSEQGLSMGRRVNEIYDSLTPEDRAEVDARVKREFPREKAEIDRIKNAPHPLSQIETGDPSDPANQSPTLDRLREAVDEHLQERQESKEE